ncbi:esterase-like activity of phytase family protein [Cytophagales bacterium LB-30]|uniref:Esterase-like activity of phytase family protein n=1 Tax=Shiella aurantiaca TaxID=3058365 RepID=A0ABT8F6Y8_9BACT|nr:esterase-like activity of phytase family protein [Shiella aurantiaca]MDN4166225.1 esterase-like activity of phytase family protein [Shiella aurantiaca]
MKPPFLLSIVAFLFSLTAVHAQGIDSLRLIDVYSVGFGKYIGASPVGGLSGIDYVPEEDRYYVICDDRSEFGPARFYKVLIRFDEKRIDTVCFEQVFTLKTPEGTDYPLFSIDPEAIRYVPSQKTLLYTSEGDRNKGVQPFFREMTSEGFFLREIPLPKNFAFFPQSGLRHNGALESISLAKDTSALWIINEEPLMEDGPRAQVQETQSPLRLTLMDYSSGKIRKQYAYMLGPLFTEPASERDFRVNSVPEILAISDSELLIIERAFIANKGNHVRVLAVSTEGATDIQAIDSLIGAEYVPVKRKELFNFSGFGLLPDNIEGISFGPTLPNGHRTLVFISDDNFSESQTTQFWVFELFE